MLQLQLWSTQTITDLKEQCVCVKSYFKLNTNAVKAFRMLKVASEEQIIGRSQVFEQFSKFKSGETIAEDATHSAHHLTNSMEQSPS
jgi:hypothetical protein